MHTIIARSSLLLTACLVLSVGSAQHNPDNDVYITLNAPVVNDVTKTLRIGRLGRVLYETQEAVHETIKDTTGEEIDRYYIHVCSGDECIPIDPFRVHD